ncbi:MAG: hypothetical protein WBQ76_03165 [Candidatus Korobacteraceae bacterium]
MPKPLMIRMLDVLEDLYFENTLLKAAVEPRWPQMNSFLADAKKNRGAVDRVHALFAPLRAEAQQSAEPERLLEAFLRIFPANKDVN